MNRFADEIVPFEFRIAWRRASWPTRRSPCSVNATTEGVVRDPSALGITTGWPPSTVAITEFVVPRSIPTALAIVMLLSTLVDFGQIGVGDVQPGDGVVGGVLIDDHIEALGLYPADR